MTRHTLNWMALFTAVVLALPGVALADHAMEKNGMLVDHSDMTLYTFDKDTGGKSMCSGECAKNWPPLMVKAGEKAEGKWTQIKRDDGSMQWAYDGKPLYTFVKDKKAGDTMGDGMKDVWHVAKP
ncbi:MULTISPECIES: hypothetical protein [Pseudomonas]|uniref:Lipoprotein with Yx(FWY)xxD motif n=1 Tax=Pseudomonas donghuensis TaxID=1163398 RepID=A0AAP0SJG7_9PSED|nr:MULTISPECIES: hypothetical protein [Pseudomonas]MDF9896127.1 putative lipoprotein with Yx(FWY)xxD motif [Pseudomonas vranovensis]KDN99795.2 hypothetical protein BV82_2208 [Pseudomonas donghuensis]MBF4209304.1 hypothetical protein [Pseudomonas donghuensis]MBS7598545.1 hypothetical protein [Pseudomonas sp. RC2C2]MCP6690235.1 hypothetical protein [Pseudomonas donghuensis]